MSFIFQKNLHLLAMEALNKCLKFMFKVNVLRYYFGLKKFSKIQLVVFQLF